jgi:hypothetical protein
MHSGHRLSYTLIGKKVGPNGQGEVGNTESRIDARSEPGSGDHHFITRARVEPEAASLFQVFTFLLRYM